MASRTTKKLNKISDSTDFFLEAVRYLNWGRLSGELVVDIGCGSGKSSWNLVSMFPDIDRVVAFDFMPDKIRLANETNPHPKIIYEVANIEDRSTLTKWEGKLSRVVSVHCFHILTKQKMGFQNLYHLLRAGGEAALLLSLNSPFYDFIMDIARHPKWQSYIVNANKLVPECHMKKLTPSYFRSLLEEIGFEVVKCEEEMKVQECTSDDDCQFTLVSNCPFAVPLSKALMQEFIGTAFQCYLEHSPRTAEGRSCVRNNTLTLLLRKPARGDTTDPNMNLDNAGQSTSAGF